MHRRLLAFLANGLGLPAVLALLTLTLAGCAHYQLGTGATAPFATLYVEPVVDDAAIPQASALVGTQIRDAFLRDGRVRLVDDPGAADATLTVRLVQLDRTTATSRTSDSGLARKLLLDLGAEVTLHDNRNATDYLKARPIRVQRQVFTDGGQLQAEYMVLPHLATEIARETTHAVLDVW